MDLTTLADVKAWLKITGTTDDALLAKMITGASAFIESWTSRTIALTPYTETRDGHGGFSMLTRNYPIASVASVTIDNKPVPLAANNTQPGYLFDDIAVYLQQGYRFAPGRQNIVISYTAGYAAVPSDIAMCCWELVAKKYRERDRIGQTSKTLGTETMAFTASDLTNETRNILRNFNKVVPV